MRRWPTSASRPLSRRRLEQILLRPPRQWMDKSSYPPALDAAGFTDTAIMSYSTKFASSFYGPFREAAGTALKGDRKTYQMNPMNRREAIRESLLDEARGADCLMVKPAGAYLDVLREIRERTELPLGAYR